MLPAFAYAVLALGRTSRRAGGVRVTTRGRTAAVAVAAALSLGLLGGCASPGTVVVSARCKTSWCITVKQDSDGERVSEIVDLSTSGLCHVGDRWPDCKNVAPRRHR